jgi:hypothetical protein
VFKVAVYIVVSVQVQVKLGVKGRQLAGRWGYTLGFGLLWWSFRCPMPCELSAWFVWVCTYSGLFSWHNPSLAGWGFVGWFVSSPPF